MRASRVIEILEVQIDVLTARLENVLEDNARLTAALLAQAGDTAAAVIVRPRRERQEGDPPTDVRPLGM